MVTYSDHNNLAIYLANLYEIRELRALNYRQFLQIRAITAVLSSQSFEPHKRNKYK